MPHPQLPHDLKRNIVVAAKQAVGFLLQRSFQRINGLPCGFDAGVYKPLIHRDAIFGESTQISTGSVGVDRIDGAADKKRDTFCAELKQDAGHFAGSGDLIVVDLRDRFVLAPPNEYEGRFILPQKVDAGIVRHCIGEDRTVHFMAGKLSLQLEIFRIGRIAQQQVIAALVCHGADAAHALAQKRKVQRNETFGNNHCDVIGAHRFAALNRSEFRTGAPHIRIDFGTGLFADTTFSGKSA